MDFTRDQQFRLHPMKYAPCSWVHTLYYGLALLRRHNEPGGVSNHQPHNCLLNRLFGNRSKKTSKLRVTGLCVGNSPETGELPAQKASNAEKVSIWWRHHGTEGLGNFNPSMEKQSHYPFPNFNGYTVAVWEWINNFIPHFIMAVITCPWLGFS